MNAASTDTADRRRTLWGYAASLGAVVGYGAAAVASRVLVDGHTTPLVASTYSLVFGTAMVAVLFHRGAGNALATADRRGWLFFSLSGVASAWGVGFLFYALQEAPVAIVSPISGAYPLVAIVLTHLFLQRLERVTARTVLGAILVVAGVTIITIAEA